MAFTYLGTLSNDLDKVRFFIGDTVENSGPKPSGGNYTDAELTGLITTAGSWQQAVVLTFRNLASRWSSQASTVQIGEYRVTYAEQSAKYAELADQFEASAATDSWANIIGWHSTTASGDAVGKMFGHKQWGADPVDWSE